MTHFENGTGTKGSGSPWYPVTFAVDHDKQVTKIRFTCLGETMGVLLDDVSLSDTVVPEFSNLVALVATLFSLTAIIVFARSKIKTRNI